MRYFFLTFLLFLSSCHLAFAGQTLSPFTGKPDKCLTVQEEDGSPSNTGCWPIKVTNGTLTDNTGSFSLSTGGGGSGDNITVNTTAATNANFLDNLYIDWAIDTAATPDDITAKFNYAETLAGNPALLTGECILTIDGIICEGTTADTIEMKLAFPDPATTDKTITLPNATDTLVGKDTTDTLTNKTMAAASNVIDADTAVALAANGVNCAASSFPLGVDASGAVESCSTSISGNAATATALAADPADCGANTFATTIAASGALTCATPALGTDTSGNYVATVADGTGIDGTASGEGTTYTPTFDATELEALTWGAGGNASNIWTFNLSGTDPTITFNSGAVAIGGALSATGAVTGSNLSGTNTGDNTVATSGDSAISFFSSGTLEVAIGGTGTTTSTGTGAVVLGTSPTIATPIETGKTDRNNVAVDDDDCTGEQGLYWYDTTDSRFEFCDANSGTPTAISAATDTNAVKEYWWPASASLPLEVADSIPPISKDAGTNIDQLTVDLDDSTDECRTVSFKVPSDVTSGSTITFRWHWYSAAATSGNAIIEIRHNGGVAEGTDPDQALTVVAAAADATQGTAGQITVTTWTETLANLGWAANEQVDAEFCRDANNASDTLVGDLKSTGFGVEIPRS